MDSSECAALRRQETASEWLHAVALASEFDLALVRIFDRDLLVDASIVLPQIVGLLEHVLDHSGEVSRSFLPWELVCITHMVDLVVDSHPVVVLKVTYGCLSPQDQALLLLSFPDHGPSHSACVAMGEEVLAIFDCHVKFDA